MTKRFTPIKAIRAKCLDCTCNQPKEVRDCHITTCTLWPYRMGRRPHSEALAGTHCGRSNPVRGS